MTWIELAPTVSAAFLASLVECVEAATIVLAVGTVRGWKSAFVGTGLALAALVVLVLALGPALSQLPEQALQLFVGILLLLFGMRWLRKPPGAVLVEVKTSAFAQDVHTGTGQLMLYPKIMPELAHHRRVLLLPEGVTSALRTAVEACDIALHTYIRKDTDGPEPLTITFHASFRRLCGLP